MNSNSSVDFHFHSFFLWKKEEKNQVNEFLKTMKKKVRSVNSSWKGVSESSKEDFVHLPAIHSRNGLNWIGVASLTNYHFTSSFCNFLCKIVRVFFIPFSLSVFVCGVIWGHGRTFSFSFSVRYEIGVLFVMPFRERDIILYVFFIWLLCVIYFTQRETLFYRCLLYDLFVMSFTGRHYSIHVFLLFVIYFTHKETILQMSFIYLLFVMSFYRAENCKNISFCNLFFWQIFIYILNDICKWTFKWRNWVHTYIKGSIDDEYLSIGRGEGSREKRKTWRQINR